MLNNSKYVIANTMALMLIIAGAIASTSCSSGANSEKAARPNIEKKDTMQTVISKDGSKISFEKTGQGPAVILIHGALASSKDHDDLAQLLSQHFTVYNYDRRGHGNTPDNKQYRVERELEDIAALIDAAGGSAFIYGISSGAALAFEAAARLGDKVKKLAMYEAPYDEAAGAAEKWKTYKADIEKLNAAGKGGEAVAYHMQYVGAPEKVITDMKASPNWPAIEAMAPTLAYDIAAVGDDRSISAERAANITASALIMDGSASAATMPFMRRSAEKLASVIPNAQHKTLEGQAHGVSAAAVGPVLLEFFKKG
jgi:pimeloyl-ACP methyl ester carboxylesterase